MTSERKTVFERPQLQRGFPTNSQGRNLRVSQFYNEHVFSLDTNRSFSAENNKKIKEVMAGKVSLSKSLAKVIADEVLKWALEKGATHFCHWFQPLTGSTAEKHDSFLSFDGDRAIEHLSASQLIQGEPDASSFPNGGTRSTFEARGYTSWDLSSPIFIKESISSKTLCIPTAFISYHGHALDIKTPLLRSMNILNESCKEFLSLLDYKDVKKVQANCGYEQEYFLVDKAFYFNREDLVMTGRTLVGSLTTRNQQLDDHYFGTISTRVLSFMQDLEVQLYKLGIPAKTRHNEVAPGQFEIAPIFKDANTASDNNQLLMAVMKEVAESHSFVCLFHEKPFAGVNGSGKHLNWSVSDDKGRNFLEPGDTPHDNYRFLAMVAITCEAVRRHAVALRAAIASVGNDHRLGANEAPPSIISVFLGDTVKSILDKMISGQEYTPDEAAVVDTGTQQLAQLLKDNTDRNRTSPFAFTGNKFEFRAVGSNAAIGIPLTILNTAFVDVIKDSIELVKEYKSAGKTTPEVLKELAKKWYSESQNIVFNGDGYGQEWLDEAEKRGLPNLKTTVDALVAFKDSKNHQFLIDLNAYNKTELETICHVNLEQYNVKREIEFQTQIRMVEKHITPSINRYKSELAETLVKLETLKIDCSSDKKFLENLCVLSSSLNNKVEELKKFNTLSYRDDEKCGRDIIETYLPVSEHISEIVSKCENLLASDLVTIPTYFDLLFVR